MTPSFNAADRSTWKDLLSLPEVAELVGRKVGGIRKALEQRTFVPAPVHRYPYRWAKADVIAYLDRRAGDRPEPRVAPFRVVRATHAT
jgi:hypothetical protein